MDLSDKQSQQIKEDIDVLHGLHQKDEKTEFNNKLAAFIKAAKSNLTTVHAWLQNPPAEYATKEYAWLKSVAKEIAPSNFDIITKEIALRFNTVLSSLKKRRDKYTDNKQWFSSFTKEEKDTLEEAASFKDQYDEIKASLPGDVKELASLHGTYKKQGIGGAFLGWLASGDIGSSIQSTAGKKYGFKSGHKVDMSSAWRKMKNSVKKAGKAIKSTSKSAGPASTATKTGTVPTSDIPESSAVPSGDSTSETSTEEVTDVASDASEDVTVGMTSTGKPKMTPSSLTKKSSSPAGITKPTAPEKPSSPTGITKPTASKKSGIEKDSKEGVIIKGYETGSGEVRSLDELFGGAAAVKARRSGGGSSAGGYVPGAGFSNMLDEGGGGGGDDGGGFLDNLRADDFQRNKDKDKKKNNKKKNNKNKTKNKPKRTPKNTPKRTPKPKGKLGRMARWGKNLFSKGKSAKNVANVARGANAARNVGMMARLGGTASTVASLGSTTMTGIAAGGAGAVAGTVAAAAAAGYAGWKIGSWIDKKTGFSDWGSDKLTSMGDTGVMQKNQKDDNAARKAIAEASKGKPKMDPKTRRMTQAGWDYRLAINARGLQEAERDYEKSKDHGMWSSGDDKDNEKQKLHQLKVSQKSAATIKKRYKEWQDEGGENWKDPYAGKHPEIRKAGKARDSLVKIHKRRNNQEGIKAAQADYEMKVKKIEEEMKKKSKDTEAKDTEKKATPVKDFAMKRPGRRFTKGKTGFNNRVIMGPEGEFKLDKKDDLLAGTDLFGKDKKKSEVYISNKENEPVPVSIIKRYDTETKAVQPGGGLFDKLKLKSLGLSLFAGAGGVMGHGMNQIRKQPSGSMKRVRAALQSVRGQDAEEVNMEKGILAGQKKFIKSKEAIGKGSIWGDLLAANEEAPWLKKDFKANRGQLVTISSIAKGALAAEIDASSTGKNIHSMLTSLRAIEKKIWIWKPNAQPGGQEGASVAPKSPTQSAGLPGTAPTPELINDPIQAIRASQTGLG